jgi:serine protease AprX
MMSFKTRRHANWGRKKLTQLCQLISVLVLATGMAHADGDLLSSLLSGLTSSGSGSSNTYTPKHLSKDIVEKLKNSTSSELIDVIVQFKPSAYTPSGNIKGYGQLKSFGSIKAGQFRLPASVIADLENDDNVLYVTPNRKVQLQSTDRMIQTVYADVAQSYGWNGQGVTVAIIDSGISAHDDLKDANGNYRILYNESFVGGESAADLYGHGTHVAGILAGNGFSSRYDGYYMIQGVAPNANLVNLKVLDRNGLGTDSQVINAIQRAINLKSTYNIKIINLSLGRPIMDTYTKDPLCQAVEAAWKAGIVVVVSAGNNGRDNTYGTMGYGTIQSPGNDPYAITVGAMNTRNSSLRQDDVIASYSSKGPTAVDQIAKPDLVAPGNAINSLIVPGATLETQFPALAKAATLTDNIAGTPDTQNYFTLSGTSMAAPVVAGTAALILQKDPTATPDTIKARIMKTADKKMARGYIFVDPATGVGKYLQHDIFTVGAGYVNVQAAVSSTEVVASGYTAVSPFARRNTDGSIVLTSNAAFGTTTKSCTLILCTTTVNSVIWGNSVVWGNSVIWGSSVIWGNDNLLSNSVIWGSSVVWGNATLSGNSVIWGASVIWGGLDMEALSEGDGDTDNEATNLIF